MRADISCSRVESPPYCGNIFEILGVTSEVKEGTIHIYNVNRYPDNTSHLDISELLALCSITKVFIGGDFNAHHPILGSH